MTLRREKIMSQIVECIPNFSEGRRIEVVDSIVKAIEAHNDIRVLHRTSDADHNRSVITFVGSPDAVMEAAFRAIRTAADLIDLEQHQGVHPRIGATDVVPFVPIEDMTMEDCVRLARKLGQRVGDELSIPIYLYEEAALRPERKNLANLRKGQYEGLKELISTAERYPDYGPAILGAAGATVIGARKPLIAFNVFLNTEDIHIAEIIARNIRGSSGGLVEVKALGLKVKGKAQVSMNLTDYKRTPIYRVMEILRMEAAKLGVSILRSELIGLMPQDALVETAAWYLQLPDLKADLLLENRLLEKSR
jgi:glutamate formiminotransferase